MTLVKEGLERSVPFLIRADESASEGDGLTLTGHAAVFNQETVIDSWEGSFVESISPGAFRKTVRERTPVLQFDHGRHPLVGSIPIGSIETLREDEEGLFVEGRLADNWLIQPVREAIENRSIKGMSFRFDVIREKWEDNAGKEIKDPDELRRLLWGYEGDDRLPLKRTLKELRVHELGPVVFPAYTGTSVDVRSREIAQTVLNDSELVREVRSALALEKDVKGINPDEELRREVAKALLFGMRVDGSTQKFVIDQPDKPKTPLIDMDALREAVRNEPSIRDTHKEEDKKDAPLNSEHPSRPVRDDLRSRMNYALRSMGRRLDSVSEELLGGEKDYRA